MLTIKTRGYMDFSIYNFTFGVCFGFWAYFDSISNILLKYKIIRFNGSLSFDSIKNDKTLKTHLALKILFYIIILFLLFEINTTALLFAFVGFFIGANKSKQQDNIDDAIINDDNIMIEKGIKYCTISFFSAIVFSLYFIL